MRADVLLSGHGADFDMSDKKGEQPQSESLLGFDDFQISLGDKLRGERATLGLSLLDVQRELRIKADFLAAIEDSNPEGFDSPGFIAGYVRSYARFLKIDPEEAFRQFCRESGFSGVHGQTGMTRTTKLSEPRRVSARMAATSDPALGSALSRLVETTPWYGRLDPGALGSASVMIALIMGLAYGGWSVLQELQRVNVVPVEASPALVAQVDPLDGALTRIESDTQAATATPSMDALDRLYRPQALDVPVMTPRDGPIAGINPDSLGPIIATTAPNLGVPSLSAGQPITTPQTQPGQVQVVADAAPGVSLLAVSPAWVRVRAADGTVLLEKIMEAGERYVLPATEEPPILRAGASGSVFFVIDGQAFGPAGAPGSVANNIALGADQLRARYTVADLTARPDLAAIVNVADASAVNP